MPEHCGGWPFLDLNHMPQRLLTLVACVRITRRDGSCAAPTCEDLAAVLAPDRALRIRALDLPKPLPGGALTARRQQEIRTTVNHLAALLPQWEPLLRALPLTYLPMPPDRPRSISASCFAWPQYILLAEPAFASRAVLAEQLLHETCHQWLYLCEELAPLQHPGCTHRITLPSGTGDRSPAELLGAAHVAHGLHRLWPRLDIPTSIRERRLDHLASYTSGCRTLISAARPCLTPHGHALADRILETTP